MNKYLAGLIIALTLFFSQQKIRDFLRPRPKTAPVQLTQSLECQKKNGCGVIYVAPWCPACNSMQPQIQQILQKSRENPDYGIVVIVGQGKEARDNFEKAQEIGEGTVTDDDSLYARALKIDRYPTFLVVDSQQKITHRDQAAMGWMNHAFAER